MAATDEAQVEFAQRQGRVIFTQDADFLRLHRAGVSHSSITYCVQGNRSVGEIIRGLVLIWELLELEEMVGEVEFL
jgi:predicted nuclease of predicted toxin-antitoxin system